jgi:GntR family transcriptional regulator
MALLAAPSALYLQVVAAISADVRGGALRHGDRLPGERELAERFDVSRVTIRRALAELASAGLIESKPGRGNFVTNRVLGESANSLMSFSQMGAERGLTATARVLDVRIRGASLDEADLLLIAPGAPVFELRRVRMLDALPVSIDHSRLPAERVPGIDGVDFSTASLYSTMEGLGCGPKRADYTVRAVAADEGSAAHLDVAIGAPLLTTSTRSFDADGRIVELGEMIYRGDRYQFRASLIRSGGSDD